MPSSSSDTQESPSSSSIQVYCRLRPQNALEREFGASSCSTVVDNRGVFIRSAHCEVDDLRCTFDRIFDVDATQARVYENSAKHLVNDFLQGSNCTIFAYGQTGSGKTHTISGCMDASACTERMVNPSGGIIPRLIRDLYREKERQQADTNCIEFKASFVEIYLEQIRDLLHGADKISRSSAASIGSQRNNGGLLRIRECSQRGIFISDMTELVAPDADAMIEYVRLGTQQRAVTSTKMNKDSSRSHSVFTITMTHFRTMVDGSRIKLKSCTMYIVDLAGSELVNKSNVSGKVLQEAISINKSLSALSNVIKALAEGKKHVPFRDSKLTRILQDSLSGRAKIALILTASCSTYNLSETLSTLRFGLRAKELKNTLVSSPSENDEMSKENMKELYLQAMEAVSAGKREIEALKQQLKAQSSSPVFSDDESGCESLEGDSTQPDELDEGQWIPTKVDGAQSTSYTQLLERVLEYERNEKIDRENDELNDLKMRLEEITLSVLSVEPPSSRLDAGPLTLGKLLQQSDWREVLSRGEHNIIEIHCASTPTDSLLIAEAFSRCPELHRNNDSDAENTSICVDRVRSEERGLQICVLRHKLQSLAQLYLIKDHHEHPSSLSAENATLKKRVEELEMLLEALRTQVEVDEQASELRLAEQGNHMACLQSSLQQYQTLFRSQITKYQDKYRLLREELFVYRNDTSIQANNFSVRRLSFDSQNEAEDEEIGMYPQEGGAVYCKGADGMPMMGGTLPNLQIHAPIVASVDAMQVKKRY